MLQLGTLTSARPRGPFARCEQEWYLGSVSVEDALSVIRRRRGRHRLGRSARGEDGVVRVPDVSGRFLRHQSGRTRRWCEMTMREPRERRRVSSPASAKTRAAPAEVAWAPFYADAPCLLAVPPRQGGADPVARCRSASCPTVRKRVAEPVVARSRPRPTPGLPRALEAARAAVCCSRVRNATLDQPSGAVDDEGRASLPPAPAPLVPPPHAGAEREVHAGRSENRRPAKWSTARCWRIRRRRGRAGAPARTDRAGGTGSTRHPRELALVRHSLEDPRASTSWNPHLAAEIMLAKETGRARGPAAARAGGPGAAYTAQVGVHPGEPEDEVHRLTGSTPYATTGSASRRRSGTSC